MEDRRILERKEPDLDAQVEMIADEFREGFGTPAGLFESRTRIQTGKIVHFPVVLFGSRHWRGLLEWKHDRLLPEGMISPEDDELLVVTDEPAAVVETILACLEKRCAHTPAAPARTGGQ